MLSWGFFPPWPSRCVFSVFIPKAYQEALKRFIHRDVLLFHEVKEGMAELDLNAQGSGVMFHDRDRQKAFLLRLYKNSVNHLLHTTFPMFLPIWEAEPEVTLEAADPLKEKRKDSVTVGSLFSAKKRASYCFKKLYF